jgi:hypothetical protein
MVPTGRMVPEGKMRVTSGSWDNEKVLFPGQVREVRSVAGTLHVARKERHHDEWDVPTEPYDPTDRASKRSMRKPQVTRHSDDVTAR